MSRKLILLLMVFMALMLVACSEVSSESTVTSVNEKLSESESSSEDTSALLEETPLETNTLGEMSPEDALVYMQATENLVIVDVATTNHYNNTHFEGAINIPIEELDAKEIEEKYMAIPSDVPVLVHCRLGMIVPKAYEQIKKLRPDIPEIGYIDGAPLFDKYNAWCSAQSTMQEQILLGGQTPQDALEYMKNTPNLVIVEVNAPEWKLSNGITGAMWIPYTEMAERYDEIPTGQPVLLHCGGGIVSVEAYEILLEKRPNIPELSYIAGAPPVKAYNEWLKNE